MATRYRQSGLLIRQSRIDKGWTHEDMSAAIFTRFGVNYQTSARTIYRAEHGQKPSVRKQFAIAMILDTVPSQLWSERPRAFNSMAAA